MCDCGAGTIGVRDEHQLRKEKREISKGDNPCKNDTPSMYAIYTSNLEGDGLHEGGLSQGIQTTHRQKRSSSPTDTSLLLTVK